MAVPAMVGLGVAVACSIFVFLQMRPDLLLANTTPAGGDMGAHVWGPAYLRDHLLGQGRLTGWTPDWYAGFPAFHFYMVIPSLAIVIINGGFGLLLGLPIVALIIGGTFWFTKDSDHARHYRLLAVISALLLLAVPYGVAFKLVSVVGLITFPLAAWAMCRLARAPEPVPAFISVASLIFLFDTNFTIYGGNIASTLAGEFAFSISLSITLLAIGLIFRGMDGNTLRARAAIAISLVALTHLIPVFFLMVAAIAIVIMGRGVPRLWPLATGVAMALLPVAFAEGTSGAVSVLAVVAALVTFAAVILAEPEVKARATWLLITGPTAILLSAFWLLPFYFREPFFNDMGWERLNEVGPAMLTVPMKVALPLAAVGAVTSIAQRERIGVLFTTTGLVFGAAVANLGEGPLWNARLLPFYYLSVYVLAAVGVAMVVRFIAMGISENFARPDHRVIVASSVVGLLAGIIAVGVPLRFLPFGVTSDDGTYRWLAFTSHARSIVPTWTAWNYSGYERKPSYREYHDVVTAMGQIGEVNGCGRAMWEYSSDLDRYGTPMALMLLPHWTDGCIGSMEGLYFESSATTPFHFLNQSVLSKSPSRAQRDLPYQGFNIQNGIEQLQVTGVRYYMAQTDESIAAARDHPDLVEVGEAQPFVVFEVGGSDLVEGLAWEPIVVNGQSEEEAGELATRFDTGWVSQAITFYNDPSKFRALPAEDGPNDWARVSTLIPLEGESIDPATVSSVVIERSRISFTVDQVGTPVLVKASYFPNWGVDGADGPWRIGPNLMVVVPTETSVELQYGRTAIDWLAILATLIGFGAVGALAVVDRRRFVKVEAAEVWGEPDQGWENDLAVLTGELPQVKADGERPPSDWAAPVMVEPESVDVSPAPDADTAAPVDAGTASAGTTVATALAGPDVAASNGDDGEGDGATPVEVETKLSTEVSREKPNSS
ncbi:MAG: hypothetical protein GY724_21025 [Actinomycetia bacterium]|nr:hypothetical protein [Actinomycetes bacterium]